jgi:hypothetical protein
MGGEPVGSVGILGLQAGEDVKSTLSWKCREERSASGAATDIPSLARSPFPRAVRARD